MSYYRELIIEAFKEGLLLLVKWGLLVGFIIYGFNYSLDTRNKSVNGEQAAILLIELQKKGYLPQLVNGAVPDMVKSTEVKPTEKK